MKLLIKKTEKKRFLDIEHAFLYSFEYFIIIYLSLKMYGKKESIHVKYIEIMLQPNNLTDTHAQTRRYTSLFGWCDF